MFRFKQIMPVMLAAVIFLFVLPVQSQQTTKGVKNIVLVHGAFADGSSWAKIIPALRAKGFNVIAVQNPLTSLADDVAANYSRLEEQTILDYYWRQRSNHTTRPATGRSKDDQSHCVRIEIKSCCDAVAAR